MWLQWNGTPKVPVSKLNRHNILIICKEHVIMLMMTRTTTTIYPCNTQTADHNSNASSRITIRNRRKPKSTDSISFHVTTKPTKSFYYEARYFSGNSGYSLRFRTEFLGSRLKSLWFSSASLVDYGCCVGGGGQLDEQIKQEFGRLDLGDIRWRGRNNGDGKQWV